MYFDVIKIEKKTELKSDEVLRRYIFL